MEATRSSANLSECDSKVELTKDREEVERLQQELVQAEQEAKTPADGVANPQEPQVGEIRFTEEVR